jgi:hypothetical protein
MKCSTSSDIPLTDLYKYHQEKQLDDFGNFGDYDGNYGAYDGNNVDSEGYLHNGGTAKPVDKAPRKRRKSRVVNSDDDGDEECQSSTNRYNSLFHYS